MAPSPHNWNVATGILKRLGTVLYIVALLLVALYGAAFVMDSGPQSFGIAFLIAGLSLIGAILVLEIIRRTILYIFSGEKFSNPKLGLTAKIFGVLSFGLLVLSPFALYAIDKPAQQQKVAAEVAAELAVYQSALAELPTAKTSAIECNNRLESSVAQEHAESPACRSTKLGYDSCREGGISAKSCLYMYDYESVCADKPTTAMEQLLKDSKKAGCNQRVNELEKQIADYERAHPELARPQ